MDESVAQIGAVVDALIERSDEVAKIAHHMALPLKQILLICFQKLHDQLTVGC